MVYFANAPFNQPRQHPYEKSCRRFSVDNSCIGDSLSSPDSLWRVYHMHIIGFTLFLHSDDGSSSQHVNIHLCTSICSCKLDEQHHRWYKSYQLSRTHSLTHKDRDPTLCCSVNMMDREETAGCCADDACSHQSFNLSLSIFPAELPLFHTPIVCPCPDSALIIETYLCRNLSQDALQGMREKEERWGAEGEQMNRIRRDNAAMTDTWRSTKHM